MDADVPLPVLPGFREIAARRRRVIDTLAEARRAAGLSQRAVAAHMGTSQPVVARLEAGGADVRLSTLARYADAVGHDLDLRVTPRDPASPTCPDAAPPPPGRGGADHV